MIEKAKAALQVGDERQRALKEHGQNESAPMYPGLNPGSDRPSPFGGTMKRSLDRITQLETELEEANRRVAEVEAELDKFLQAIESDSVEGGDAGAVVSRRVSVNDALAEWKYIWTVWNESMEAIMLGEAWPKNSFPSLIERAGFAALKARAEAAGTRLAG